MSKLIFCKFLGLDGNPRGRDYIYKADIDCGEGDYVLVEVVRSSAEPATKKVIVTKTDVSPEDIPGYESFKDKIKTIIGFAPAKETANNAANKTNEDVPVVNIEDL